MTFMYDLDQHPLDMCKNELPTSRLSKVMVLQPVNVCMVTSRQVTKTMVTPFDPSLVKSHAACTLHGSVF